MISVMMFIHIVVVEFFCSVAVFVHSQCGAVKLVPIFQVNFCLIFACDICSSDVRVNVHMLYCCVHSNNNNIPFKVIYRYNLIKLFYLDVVFRPHHPHSIEVAYRYAFCVTVCVSLCLSICP